MLVLFAYLLVLMLYIAALAIFLLWSWVLVETREIPFVPSSHRILPFIIKALNISSKSVMYDLGCGDGRVLFTCAANEPRAIYIGIEKAKPLVWLIRLKKRILAPKSKIIFYPGDFFQYDLSKATHIFIYLSQKLMDEIFCKLIKELKPGARVVSCDFKFINKEPIKIIDLKLSEAKLNHRLYIYEF